MQNKQCRHTRTGPKSLRHFSKTEKEQQRIQDVQENVDEVMSERLVSEDFPIEHMRNPGERMPIAAMKSCESPLYLLPIKSLLDLPICRHISRIIVIHKAV